MAWRARRIARPRGAGSETAAPLLWIGGAGRAAAVGYFRAPASLKKRSAPGWKGTDMPLAAMDTEVR